MWAESWWPCTAAVSYTHLVQIGAFIALAADDERRAGFVDEDGVHLVHNGKVEAALDLVLFIDDHVVPQVVKAELVVGAVGLSLIHI